MGWFYITEPRDTKWVATPKFRSRIHTRLTSWKEKGLSWGSSVELDGLHKCIRSMASKKLKFVNIVQVMLFRRILPCQQRAFNLWEFDPAQHQTLRKLFDTMHKDVWRVLFKGAEVPPSHYRGSQILCEAPSQCGKLSLPIIGYLFFIV